MYFVSTVWNVFVVVNNTIKCFCIFDWNYLSVPTVCAYRNQDHILLKKSPYWIYQSWFLYKMIFYIDIFRFLEHTYIVTQSPWPLSESSEPSSESNTIYSTKVSCYHSSLHTFSLLFLFTVVTRKTRQTSKPMPATYFTMGFLIITNTFPKTFALSTMVVKFITIKLWIPWQSLVTYARIG